MAIPSSGNPEIDSAVADLFDAARKNDNGPSRPRKHHLVPASYLVRWEVEDKIRVTETDTRLTYLNAAEVAARETDFYRMESEDLDPDDVPPLLFETILSRVEGAGRAAIDLVLTGGVRALGPVDVQAMSQFLAFQIARGRARRREIMDMANKAMLLQFADITDDGIRQRLEQNGAGSTSQEVASMRIFIDDWKAGKYVVGPQPAAQVALASMAAEDIAMTLLGRRWWIYGSSSPIITCDEPVVAIGGPGQDRCAVLGVGTAGVVVFPLDPHHVLAMFHPGIPLDAVALHRDLLPSEVDELNAELAAASDRWMFEQSSHRRTTTLLVPPWPNESTTFEDIEVVNDPQRQYMRSFRPNRWARFRKAPRSPIERWWPSTGWLWINQPIVWEDMEYAQYNSLGS
jgi:hypothetical protein